MMSMSIKSASPTSPRRPPAGPRLACACNMVSCACMSKPRGALISPAEASPGLHRLHVVPLATSDQVLQRVFTLKERAFDLRQFKTSIRAC